MTCHDYKDLMMGYLDNELSDEQRNRFEEHLAGCPECAGELKEFQKLKAITDEVTLVEPEDRIWQDYWNGSVALLGGGLLFGAFPRIRRRPRVASALALVAGLVLLANSRPFSGLVASSAMKYGSLMSMAEARFLTTAAVAANPYSAVSAA